MSDPICFSIGPVDITIYKDERPPKVEVFNSIINFSCEVGTFVFSDVSFIFFPNEFHISVSGEDTNSVRYFLSELLWVKNYLDEHKIPHRVRERRTPDHSAKELEALIFDLT